MTENPTSDQQDDRDDKAPAAASSPAPSPQATAAPAYAELAQLVLGAQPLGAVLTRVAQLAHETVPGVDEASITLIDRGRARTVAFSGQLAVALDERQYSDGYGPCMDAAVAGQTIAVEDTSTNTLYPQFAAAAARAGVKHTLSIGMPNVAQGIVGALNLYSKGEALDQDANDAAAGFAAYAAIGVGNAAVHAGALEEVEQMRTAMASRAVIEQAKGIIIANRRCTPDEAFKLLRGTSSRHNRKLRDIAQALVNDYATGQSPPASTSS